MRKKRYRIGHPLANRLQGVVDEHNRGGGPQITMRFDEVVKECGGVFGSLRIGDSPRYTFLILGTDGPPRLWVDAWIGEGLAMGCAECLAGLVESANPYALLLEADPLTVKGVRALLYLDGLSPAVLRHTLEDLCEEAADLQRLRLEAA